MNKTLEVLSIIKDDRCGPIGIDAASCRLSSALREELEVEVTAEEIVAAGSLSELVDLVEVRLDREPNGKSLIDIYAELEHLIRDELCHDINYHWYANWQGDVLNNTDSLEDVEIIIRIEETFGFSISDHDAQQMRTVGQTVRYLWQRLSEQSFQLRERPDNVCASAFTFYELRRLLMSRGHMPRGEVRLEVRLKDLMPTWCSQFCQQVSDVFGVDLPRGGLLAQVFGLEKQTTVGELVRLVAARKTTPADAAESFNVGSH